jgi:hypothetical protein
MKEAALDVALDRVGELQSRPGEVLRDLAFGTALARFGFATFAAAGTGAGMGSG